MLVFHLKALLLLKNIFCLYLKVSDNALTTSITHVSVLEKNFYANKLVGDVEA